MKETFVKPAVSAIIVKEEDGIQYILIQERQKEDGNTENGLIEIPGGKIREYESIFDSLRREVWEETGLMITYINGEDNVVIKEINGFKTITFQPYYTTQNLYGAYSLIMHTFICKAEGELLSKTNETDNIRWITVQRCSEMLNRRPELFFPMDIAILEKYFRQLNSFNDDTRSF